MKILWNVVWKKSKLKNLYILSCYHCLSVCLFVGPIITQEPVDGFWLGNSGDPRVCA